MIEAEISRLRMVAISLSKLGICPMLANSSRRHRTWTGSLPPYTSSALSQRRLNSWLCSMAMTKLKVVSVSLIMRNSAVLRSPRVSNSSSSSDMISRSSAISKGASRAPQLIRMDFGVLPAANLNLRYCFTAKWSGCSFSNLENRISTGD